MDSRWVKKPYRASNLVDLHCVKIGYSKGFLPNFLTYICLIKISSLVAKKAVIIHVDLLQAENSIQFKSDSTNCLGCIPQKKVSGKTDQ